LENLDMGAFLKTDRKNIRKRHGIYF